MKKRIQTLCLILPALMFAQLGIGTNSPNGSALIEVNASTGKGIIFPSMVITDLNSPAPVTNPADYLIVYNSDPALDGFFYWFNNKWNTFITSENVSSVISLTRLSPYVGTTGFTDDNEDGTGTYTENAGIGANQPSPGDYFWELIPGTQQTIDISRTQNSTVLIVDGISQTPTNDDDFTYLTYAIGIFVDGQLKIVRNFVHSGNGCAISNFYVSGNVENLSLGNHTVEARATIRNFFSPDADSGQITFGGASPGCSTLSTNMAKTYFLIEKTERQ